MLSVPESGAELPVALEAAGETSPGDSPAPGDWLIPAPLLAETGPIGICRTADRQAQRGVSRGEPRAPTAAVGRDEIDLRRGRQVTTRIATTSLRRERPPSVQVACRRECDRGASSRQWCRGG